jgi:hypothetical protein
MYDIFMDLEESKESELQTQANALAFEQRNADFLNKEISFFIDNLRKVRPQFEIRIESH